MLTLPRPAAPVLHGSRAQAAADSAYAASLRSSRRQEARRGGYQGRCGVPVRRSGYRLVMVWVLASAWIVPTCPALPNHASCNTCVRPVCKTHEPRKPCQGRERHAASKSHGLADALGRPDAGAPGNFVRSERRRVLATSRIVGANPWSARLPRAAHRSMASSGKRVRASPHVTRLSRAHHSQCAPQGGRHAYRSSPGGPGEGQNLVAVCLHHHAEGCPARERQHGAMLDEARRNAQGARVACGRRYAHFPALR